jgi:hypothetical protein
MNLNHLAPAIQEELLFMRRPASRKLLVHERALRAVGRERQWARQRGAWRRLRDSGGVSEQAQVRCSDSVSPRASGGHRRRQSVAEWPCERRNDYHAAPDSER